MVVGQPEVVEFRLFPDVDVDDAFEEELEVFGAFSHDAFTELVE